MNSPCATQRRARVQAPPRRQLPDLPREHADPELSDERHDDGEQHDPSHLADLRHVDREREGEEEQRAEHVAQGEEALLDLLPDARVRENDACHQGADGVGQVELLRERAHPDDEAEHGEQEELELEP